MGTSKRKETEEKLRREILQLESILASEPSDEEGMMPKHWLDNYQKAIEEVREGIEQVTKEVSAFLLSDAVRGGEKDREKEVRRAKSILDLCIAAQEKVRSHLEVILEWSIAEAELIKSRSQLEVRQGVLRGIAQRLEESTRVALEKLSDLWEVLGNDS